MTVETPAVPDTATLEWLDPVRRTAQAQVDTTGLPTSRDEEWRFTPLGPIVQGSWRPAAGSSVDPTRDQLTAFLFGHAEWPTLVFVNGTYHEGLSTAGTLPDGVRFGTLHEAIRADDPAVRAHLTQHAPIEGSGFTALNTATLADGGFFYVPARVEVAQPVHLLFVTTQDAAGTVAHPRNLIVIEREARASIIESYVTVAPGVSAWTNAVTEVAVDPAAWVEHVRIQRESEQAQHTALTHVDQQRDSHYRSFSMAMGGGLARHNLHVRLNAENAEALMYGLYITHGEQVVDNHTAIFHDQPNCRSWEVYKGILEDRSRAVFNGKVLVQPEAQKTDAKQTNRNLLLSDNAKVDTKPQLEIFADDVKCTHGATVGRLDETGLFYARSRGLSADAAQRMLTYAFAAEVVQEVALTPVREELDRLVLERLGIVA